MKQRTLFVIYAVIAAGVLGSGMLIDAFAGGIINVYARAELPDGAGATQNSLVEYRNLTLNKNIGSTNLDINGEYFIACNFEDSSGINTNTTINYNARAFGNNIALGREDVKNIGVYNTNGQLIKNIDFNSRNGITEGSFNPSGLSSGLYIYSVDFKNGENASFKTNIMEGQSSSMPSINENNSNFVDNNSKSNSKGSKLTYNIQVKITAPNDEFQQFCDTLTWEIPDSGYQRDEYLYHYLEFNPPPTYKNYVQGFVTEMMTGNPISNLPVRFVKLTERNPFGQEFKFDFNVLSETTTDVNGYYKTPSAIAVQDSVFAVIGTKDDNWMNSEYVDDRWVGTGIPPHDPLDSDWNYMVFNQMDGFFSKLPMHQASDSLQISRYGSKFVNYALYPKWNEIALRDTIPDTYVTEMDAVIEQQNLGIPIDKMRNFYYTSGRNNKCSEAIRNDVPFGIYFITKADNIEYGFFDEQIARGKEWLLQSAMIETGMTRAEAQSYPDGYGGKYRILSENPNLVSGLEPAMPVQRGSHEYFHNTIGDNPVTGYNYIGIDNGNYARTFLEDDNEFAAKKEMTSNPARGYTTYTKNINNSMSGGHRKVDQLWIPMEAKFYQKQASGDNNATMDELIGRFYGLDY
jgi:hypothetical protein